MMRNKNSRTYVKWIVLLDKFGKEDQRHELDKNGRLKTPMNNMMKNGNLKNRNITSNKLPKVIIDTEKHESENVHIVMPPKIRIKFQLTEEKMTENTSSCSID